MKLKSLVTRSRTRRTLVGSLLLSAALLFAAPASSLAQGAAGAQPDLIVLAASSLTDALNEIGPAFTSATHRGVKLSYAASSALARQIEGGAPADVFLSADTDWMDYLQTRKLIDSGSRHNVLGNRLVLISPADSTVSVTIAPHFALAKLLGDGRLVTGNPDSVPVGKYAKEALTNLGVWSEVQDKVAAADNVRAALALVARGEAPLGIVYRTHWWKRRSASWRISRRLPTGRSSIRLRPLCRRTRARQILSNSCSPRQPRPFSPNTDLIPPQNSAST